MENASNKKFEIEMMPVGSCPLCEKQERIRLLSPTELGHDECALVRCRNCGLAYLDHAPTSDALEKFYGETYLTPEYRKVDGASRPDPKMEMLETFMVMEKHVDEVEEFKTPPGRLLDVGCSYGAFLIEAASRGWETVGVEPFADAVRFCKQNLGLDVREVGLLDASAKLEEGKFDVITMWELIEHVREPAKVMQHAYELAAPGGILILTCPNALSTAAIMLRSVWQGLKFPTHLQFFGYQTMRILLESTYWKPIRITSGGGYPGQIKAIARKA